MPEGWRVRILQEIQVKGMFGRMETTSKVIGVGSAAMFEFPTPEDALRKACENAYNNVVERETRDAERARIQVYVGDQKGQ
jgi:hypothetical protein